MAVIKIFFLLKFRISLSVRLDAHNICYCDKRVKLVYEADDLSTYYLRVITFATNTQFFSQPLNHYPKMNNKNAFQIMWIDPRNYFATTFPTLQFLKKMWSINTLLAHQQNQIWLLILRKTCNLQLT